MADTAKRKDAPADPPAPKRSRWGAGAEANDAAQAATAAPPPPPALDAAAIAAAKARAREALQRAGAVKAQLAGLAAAGKLPAAAAGGGAGAPGRPAAAHAPPPPAAHAAPRPAAAASSGLHASLVLDGAGNLVDSASGRVVQSASAPTATVKANRAAQERAAAARPNPYLAHLGEGAGHARGGGARAIGPAAAGPPADPSGAARAARGRRGLAFHAPGELSAQAEELRAQARVDALFAARAAQAGAQEPAAGPPHAPPPADPAAAAAEAARARAAAAVSSGLFAPQPPPPIEWWDAQIARQAAGADGRVAPAYAHGVEPERVTHYVEHPPPVAPPAERPPPPPQPLPLTAKERRKLRTQRRHAQERERQDAVRAGLAAPPEPKVKLSNLMRALGESAVANPSAIEARVRQQVAAREAAHARRNEESRLSKDQRQQKRRERAARDLAEGVHVCVYKVSHIADRQKLHKVDINAQQLALSGVCLLVGPFGPQGQGQGQQGPHAHAASSAPADGGFSGCHLVVVEGGARAHKPYAALMLRRIRWDEGWEAEGEAAAQAAEAGAGLRARPAHRPSCALVWRGLVAKPFFKGFTVEQVRSAEAARRWLAERGAAHYWDAALAHDAQRVGGLADLLETEELLGEHFGGAAALGGRGAGGAGGRADGLPLTLAAGAGGGGGGPSAAAAQQPAAPMDDDDDD